MQSGWLFCGLQLLIQVKGVDKEEKINLYIYSTGHVPSENIPWGKSKTLKESAEVKNAQLLHAQHR